MAFARQYSIMEVKKFLQHSEGRPRTWGGGNKPVGHAIALHRDRSSVSTVRPGEKKVKSVDSGFKKAKGAVPFSDIYVAVTAAMNSSHGQLELAKLDQGDDNCFIKAGVAYDGSVVGGKFGDLGIRVSYKGQTEIPQRLTKMNIYVGRVGSSTTDLHIQTAFPEGV
jgi:hypothetical protein